MGRDKHPQERQREQLERKLEKRPSYDRILIVSEGSKTEPNYFYEIRRAYRLQMQVYPSRLGTAPIQVVQCAQALFFEQQRAFEKVYAVFDRDDHGSYHEALALAESLDGELKNDAEEPVVFQTIASVPSFELWLLLHYEDVRAPLPRKQVMQRLKKHFPGYDKGAPNAFAITREHLPVATRRAERLAKHSTAHTDPPEPFTAVFELVKLLTTLRR
ncbi:RloB domain-containing protein [Verminephrobacter aporrectodeae subsp. tuberculatae]|uniref:RloB family protein n=1 Tax=Verminephrobacter aporrectodeae TaxID=1110389 RepID=UPI002243DBA5|nr:RloB family protein [Verminephrobacter aporrectodeae]MCW8165246.1 RloB domain-containing protein [Verminephrobacter aporrectodeae subsp. tuberculatae]MCW8167820.1 RloB domain-containing protein [Verminephrobacter aporrectodeae subsp. tuberculatae]